MPVIDALKAKRGFTTAEIELSDFILSHLDEVGRMGIAELAEAAGKSNATIIRLCRKAGSSGWREFRLDLAADLEKRRRAVHRIDPDAPFQGKTSTPNIMNGIATLTREAVEDCYSGVSPASIGNLARAAVNARRVFFWARGESYATAVEFGTLMSKIGVACVPADQYRLLLESAFHATKDDLALLITYSGDLISSLDKQLTALRERRCKIGIVTSLPSVADRFSGFDYPVVVPLRENKYNKVATFYSQSCLRYVLNCVYSVAFAQNYDANLRNKVLIEKLDPHIVGPRTTTL